MNLKQQLLLGPLEKYQRFNAPPFKAVLSILLVFVTTFQVLTIVSENIYSNSGQRKSFVALYFEPGQYEQEIFEQSQYFHIRNASELQKQLQYMLETLGDVDSNSFQNISMASSKMTLSKSDFYYSEDPSNIVEEYPINITQGIKQPFDLANLSSLKTFLLSTAMFQIKVQDIILEVDGIETKWVHIIKYYYSYRAEMDISITMRPSSNSRLDIDDQRGSYFHILTAFYISVLIIATWSLFLNVFYFRRIVNGLNQYNRTLSLEGQSPNQEIVPKYMFNSTLEWAVTNKIPLRALTWTEVFEIVDVWVVLGSFGHICQMIGSIYLVFTHQPTMIVGIGCIIAWMVLYKYIRHYERMILLNQILGKSLPQIIIFMGEFIPMFFSFTIFGYTVFWKVELFSSVRKTITTQMCLLVGDSVGMITDSIAEYHNRMAAIAYVFGFVLLFMQGIHNMLTGLIKENFLLYKVQMAKKNMSEEDRSLIHSIQKNMKMSIREKQSLIISEKGLAKNQLERKKRRGELDHMINKVQLNFEILEREIKKLVTEFEHDTRYFHVEEHDYQDAVKQLKKQLTSIAKRVNKELEKKDQDNL